MAKRIYTMYDGATGRTWQTTARSTRPRERDRVVIVESRRADENIPHPNDAADWDAYRLSRGIAAR